MEKFVIDTAEGAKRWGDWSDVELCNAVRDIERHLTACKGLWGNGKGELMVLQLMKIKRRHREALALPEIKQCLKPEKAEMLGELLALLDEIEEFDFKQRNAKPKRVDEIADWATGIADRITLKILLTWYPDEARTA